MVDGASRLDAVCLRLQDTLSAPVAQVSRQEETCLVEEAEKVRPVPQTVPVCVSSRSVRLLSGVCGS